MKHLELVILAVALAAPCQAADRALRAGASIVDITPSTLPVRQNGGFLEGLARRVVDPLHARALVLDDGDTRLAIVVIDSCMVPVDVCDHAKKLASAESGIRPDRMLIAATHTHSAPGVMDYCLGSRADPAYTADLPPLLARAIVEAAEKLQPSELGFAVTDAPDHTNCRRWILRPDRIRNDPFGDRTVRAHMHPGYRNPDFVGPSGPIDPALSLLSVRTIDGHPIAVLANYSMHYFGMGGGLSSDYYGRFSSRIAARITKGERAPVVVGMMSQGTSGDLHWMDYSRARRSVSIDAYADGLVDLALGAYERISYRRDVSLAMAERRLTLSRRLPDAKRLAWAAKVMPDRSVRPRNQREVYAEQAFFIDKSPTCSVPLQALRIGEVGIAAIPCEVYGITGLRIKAHSPLERTFNMELANGGAGYIPPPEQHALGGYTTWPAATAGLEIQAERKIVNTVLELLEKVAGKPRRQPVPTHGRYARAILASQPRAYFRMDEFHGPSATDSTNAGSDALWVGNVAFYLPGPDSGAFSNEQKNRAAHLAGGHLAAALDLPGTDATIELWFWNGLPANARDVTGTLASRGSDRLVITGSASQAPGRLALGPLVGRTSIALRTWNHVLFARSDDTVAVYLNGSARPEIEGRLAFDATAGSGGTVLIGGSPDGSGSLEGKIDEVAIHDRALGALVAAEHWAQSGVVAPQSARAAESAARPSTTEDIARYTAAVRASRPVALWPLHGKAGSENRRADDVSGNGHHGLYEEGAAPRAPGTSAANFVGGRVKARVEGLGDSYSVELWFRNDLPNDARAVTGYLFSRGADLANGAPGDSLGIAGNVVDEPGCLFVFNGNARYEMVAGQTPVAPNTWNHVVLVRAGREVRIHLNGRKQPDARGELEITYPRGDTSAGKNPELIVGGRNDNFANFRGIVDQVAVYDRALTAEEITRHYGAARISEQPAAPIDGEARLESPPLSPQETIAATHVRSGYTLELVAAEPQVLDPVAVDWGPDGRLWVAEMADYPSGIDGKGQPGGRIRFLEDSTGDGQYDRSIVFADGLNFPTGVLAWRDGVLVTAAPDIVYAGDRDGDDRASGDEIQVLYSGFLPGNQQLRVNGLRRGLDNWIHCASGGHHPGHGKGNVVRLLERGVSVRLGSRDFRIRPESGLLEPQSGTSQFGRVRDDWGHWFGVQNSHPLWHYVLEDRYSSRNPHVAAPDPRQQLRIPASPPVFAAKAPQKRFHDFRTSGRFTSACGISIYRDVALFENESGITHAFTCEPFHNVVQHSVVHHDGVTFRAERAPDDGERDFFASADRWCRPVMARTGPDGALWIVDMYRYMIEHPQWLPAKGKDELRPFYRAGTDRGRIYRVVRKGTAPRPFPRLSKLGSGALVALLASDNGIQRDLAQRLLVERQDRGVISKLESMAGEHRKPLARLHALCTLDGMNALAPPLIVRALGDPNPGIVRHAIRLAEPRGAQSPELVAAAIALASSDDEKVVLQLANTLGAWKDPRAGKALGRIAMTHADDRWMRAAILSSAVPHSAAVAAAVVQAGGEVAAQMTPPLLTVALASGEYAAVTALLEPALAAEDRLGVRSFGAVSGLLAALEKRNMNVADLIKRSAGALDTLIARMDAVFAAAESAVLNGSVPSPDRVAAIDLLSRAGRLGVNELRGIGELLSSEAPGDVQAAAIRALSRSGSADAMRRILSTWKHYLPDVRHVAAEALISNSDGARALLAAIERGDLAVVSLAATERQRLLKHRTQDVAALARRVLAATVALDRDQALVRFRPALDLAGDSARGQAIFAQRCSACHAVEGDGELIGPDLRAITDGSPAGLLASIVTPNRAVEPRYLGYLAVLASGEVVNGLVAGETGNSVVFQLADGTRRPILRSAILTLESFGSSFMPDGLEADLSTQGMADLIAYLKGL